MSSEALIEVRMQSGVEFHFLGDDADMVRSKLAGGEAKITVAWGIPSNAEVTIATKYVECTKWYANGRP